MSIDEKVELVRKALERGARINVYYHNAESANDAEAFMNELGIEYHFEQGEEAQWVKHYSKDSNLTVSAFYDLDDDENDDENEEEPLPFADEEFLTGELEEVLKEDMRSEEYVSSFDLKIGEGL